jgi:RNA polymerase sigma factor (sigma-70 family)
MNLKIQNRNFDIPQNVQRLIEKKPQKIRKLLPTFSSDAVDLNVTLERITRGNQFQATLVLALPQTAIRVEELADNAAGSVLHAFDEMIRKVKRFKSQLNREKFWQRQPNWTGGVAATENVRELENAINLNLDKIENYIRREIYHQVILENMPYGLIQPEAVVDDVFLEVSAKSAARPENVPLESWMFQIAREQLRKRLENLEDSENTPRLEELQNMQSTPKWGDEDQNFYQPDEVLRLEDLLKDEKSSNPEEVMEHEEIEVELQKAVANLPVSMREAFVLFALEGFEPDEIAMITGRTPEEVIQEVADARRLLREKLRAL